MPLFRIHYKYRGTRTPRSYKNQPGFPGGTPIYFKAHNIRIAYNWARNKHPLRTIQTIVNPA